MKIKLKEAFEQFKELNPGTRSQDIAVQILPDKSESRARELFSRWCNGHDYSAIKPEVISRICEVLNVSPNFLFDHE